MRRRSGWLLALALVGCGCCLWWPRAVPLAPDALPYGVGALTLGPACSGPPPLTDPAAWSSAVHLDRFVRAAGRAEPVTPTVAALAWDEAALYVGLRCAEPNPLRAAAAVPAGPLDKQPDRVEVRLNHACDGPLLVCTLLPDGRLTTVRRAAGAWLHDPRETPVAGAELTVSRLPDRWLARLTVPWALLGGRPAATGGVNVVRLRAESDEVSSPVALDWTGLPGPETQMELGFGAAARVHVLPGTLAALPSGRLVWQRPAALVRPSRAEQRALAALQGALGRATTGATLARRVHLAQRWVDQLALDGYSFFAVGGLWSVGPGEYHPGQIRGAVTRALAHGHVLSACRGLDIFLGQLARVTREWYADGSPGNVRSEAWTPLGDVASMTVHNGVVHLDARAGGQALALRLALTSGGGAPGLRLWLAPSREAAPGLSPGAARAVERGAGLELSVPGLVVRLRRAPFRLAASDGAGRELLALGREQVRFRLGADGAVLAADVELPLSPDEALIGGGERFDSLDQRGRVVTAWVTDAWEGNIRTIRNQSYAPVPLWVSPRGWSVFWATPYRVRSDLGCAAPRRLRLTAHGPRLDLHVWLGPPRAALRSFAALTGRPKPPPRWALEPWLGGNWHRWTTDPCGDPVEAILRVARRFNELDVPHGVAYVENQGREDARLYRGLRALGLRPVAWTDSRSDAGELRCWPAADLPPERLPTARRADGGDSQYLDFSHPAAAGVLHRRWDRALELGLAGLMLDFGDGLPPDVRLHDGRLGAEAHNVYPLAYAQALERLLAAPRGDDFVLISRPGCAGLARHAVKFAGDQGSHWPGLADALRGALTSGASGYGYWTSDIGGFYGEPNEEVYLRWLQLGAFSPLMRAHGAWPREPWIFGDRATAVYRRYAWLRESLLDWLYSAALDTARTGEPMLRPLALDWPDLPGATRCEDQFVLGHDLLVAPLVRPGTQRAVLLPPGRWYDFWDGTAHVGPATITALAPLERIPVYVRAGAVLPVALAPDRAWGSSLRAGRTPALVVTPPDQPVTTRWWTTPTRPARVDLTPTPRGLRVELTGRPQTRLVRVLGWSQTALLTPGERQAVEVRRR